MSSKKMSSKQYAVRNMHGSLHAAYCLLLIAADQREVH